MGKIKILVIGSGAREHAIAWKLSQSPLCEALFCAPGNAGTAQYAENIAIADTDVPALVAFAVENEVGLVVVGGEEPLAAGLVDAVREKGIKAFGPTAEAAQIEADKVFSKSLMREASIPTAEARVSRT